MVSGLLRGESEPRTVSNHAPLTTPYVSSATTHHAVFRPLRQETGAEGRNVFGYRTPMHSYKTLEAWKRAHAAVLLVFEATDHARHPRSFTLFDQLKRATLSVEANIVEGYALGTVPLCRRHLRIAFGSAAEAECQARVARELRYLPESVVDRIEETLGGAMRAIYGLMASPPVIRRQ